MMPSTYGLFAACGCVVGVLWLKRHRAGIGVSENELWAALWSMFLGGLVGAKALFVVLGWEHYARGGLRFWADFEVGFVFFGGLVGAALVGALFAALRRLDFARGADYFAVALPLGHAFGRVGCFFAGCCHGRAGHPVQLYEALGLALIALACRRTLARVECGLRPRGAAFALYLALYGSVRFLLDLFRADGRPERLFGISHQQVIALLVIAAAAVWHYRPRPASGDASRGVTQLSHSATSTLRSSSAPGHMNDFS